MLVTPTKVNEAEHKIDNLVLWNVFVSKIKRKLDFTKQVQSFRNIEGAKQKFSTGFQLPAPPKDKSLLLKVQQF